MTTISTDGEITVLTLETERVDASAAPALKADIQKRLDGPAKKVVLDMSAVSFMDSTGLGTLVSLVKMLGSDGAMTVAGAQPTVRRLFEITRLDSLFRLTDSVVEAKALLNG